MMILKGHSEPVQSVAFSPDGTALLSVDRSSNVRLWDMRTGRLRWKADDALYSSVCFTPDGRHVLTCDLLSNRPLKMSGEARSDFDRQHPVQLRDVDTGAVELAPLDPPLEHALHLFTFAPDGQRCVARCGTDTRDLQWWKYPSGESLGHWANVVPYELLRFNALAFSPDGRFLAGMNGAGVTLFLAATGQVANTVPVRTVQDECRLAFHPDSRHIATGSGTRLALYDSVDRREIAVMTQAKKYFLHATFTPDGRQLATVSNEETVKFWDVPSGQLVRELAWQVGGLRCVAFARNGLVAAAGGMGRKVVVWDVD